MTNLKDLKLPGKSVFTQLLTQLPKKRSKRPKNTILGKKKLNWKNLKKKNKKKIEKKIWLTSKVFIVNIRL